MPEGPLELISAAFTGCSHGETCRNMAVMEALRIQLAEDTSLSEERRIGWVGQSALSAEMTIRLGDVTQERNAALARTAMIRAFLDRIRTEPFWNAHWEMEWTLAQAALAQPEVKT